MAFIIWFYSLTSTAGNTEPWLCSSTCFFGGVVNSSFFKNLKLFYCLIPCWWMQLKRSESGGRVWILIAFIHALKVLKCATNSRECIFLTCRCLQQIFSYGCLHIGFGVSYKVIGSWAQMWLWAEVWWHCSNTHCLLQWWKTWNPNHYPCGSSRRREESRLPCEVSACICQLLSIKFPTLCTCLDFEYSPIG